MNTTINKQMTFDFDGLIRLLAGHLYSEKKYLFENSSRMLTTPFKGA
jgi:hypothetical protein